MNTKEAEVLDQIREAMKGCDWRLEAVLTFSHGTAVQVYAKSPTAKRFAKVGPLLFPPDGGSVADTVRMLADLSAKETADERESVQV